MIEIWTRLFCSLYDDILVRIKLIWVNINVEVGYKLVINIVM